MKCENVSEYFVREGNFLSGIKSGILRDFFFIDSELIFYFITVKCKKQVSKHDYR